MFDPVRGGEAFRALPVAGGDCVEAVTSGASGADDGELGDACRAENADAQRFHEGSLVENETGW